MTTLNIAILASVVAYADMATLLLSCRPASRSCQRMVDEEIEFRINALFSWFARDVKGMRDCMRDNAAFIGGSLPLTLFSPLTFEPSNADVFVPSSRSAVVIEYLRQSEKFDVVGIKSVQPAAAIPINPLDDSAVVAYGAGLHTVFALRRGAKIVNVLTFDDPVPFRLNVDVLTLSWTSALFNYISADVAACAYPTLTMAGRALYHMGRFYSGMPGTSSDHLLNTYCDRGFEFSAHPSWWFSRMDTPCPRGSICPFTERMFNDEGALVLGRTGVDTGGEVSRTWIFGGVDDSVHEV